MKGGEDTDKRKSFREGRHEMATGDRPNGVAPLVTSFKRWISDAK